MRWVIVVVAAGLAACSPNIRPPSEAELAEADRLLAVHTAAARARTDNTPTPDSRAERDMRTRNEAMAAARSGQPLVPIIQRHAEENVRDGVAAAPTGRGRPMQALHIERARLMDLASAAIANMNAQNTASMIAATEQRRRESYCRSLASDIDIASSNLTDITLRVLGSAQPRENSLFRSCMSSFARSDAYMNR